jgi:hypothetical protein
MASGAQERIAVAAEVQFLVRFAIVAFRENVARAMFSEFLLAMLLDEGEHDAIDGKARLDEMRPAECTGQDRATRFRGPQAFVTERM